MKIFKINKLSKPFIRLLITIFGIIILLVIILILIISPTTKYLIEKYDEDYTGRQITLSRAYVNPFTGYIHLRNLKIYESDSLPNLTGSDSVFFSAKGLSVNIAMLKLLVKTYEISELKLNQPVGKIIQNKKDFNFNDLISKFSSKKNDTIPSPVYFNILNINIVNGVFHYHDKLIPIKYFIKEINIHSKGKRWDVDTLTTNFAFNSGPARGSIKGIFTLNFKNKNYNIDIQVHKFELDLLNQYFKDISSYGTIRANIDADFSSKGNFNDTEEVTNKGLLVINDFHLGKTPDDDYASFNNLVLTVIEMNPKKLIYLYDSIILYQPYLKYDRYDYLDNLQMMFGKDWAKITEAQADTTRFNLILKIVDLLKALRVNLPKSDFEFNKVAIVKGVLEYNDYTLGEKFSIEANPLYIRADSIFKTRNRVEIYLKSGVHPFGSLSAGVSINPKDKSCFDLKYDLNGVPASLFNPFTIAHTSFPLDRGTLELNGKWKVKNGELKSSNHLLVFDPRLGKRLKNDDNDWLPLPIIMYLIRGKDNVVDFEIPINGNITDPNFIWKDVVYDVAKNLFTKPTATSYRALMKDAEAEIEKSLTLKWEMQQNTLLKKQKRFVNKLVDHLLKNPEAIVDIYPIVYASKEMEHIGFFEAKKKFFLSSKSKGNQTLSHSDSVKVNKMSVKDTLFNQYLNKQVNDAMLFTVQDKCSALIGAASIDAKLKRLNQERENAFLYHFKQEGIENRVTIHPEKITTPYNGFSYYKTVYQGELPKHLTKAYQEMDELNDDAPKK